MMRSVLGPYLLGPNPENQGVYTGDARELAKAIPDESIDLIFTDPVYQNIGDYRWLAEMAARVLKPEGAYLAFCGIGWLRQTMEALRAGGMPHRWLCAVFVPGAGSRIAQRAFCNWQALLWGGGEPRRHLCDAVISHTATLTGSHHWKKNMVPLAKYLDWFTDRNAIIWDPYTGGGTVPAVCKMLGRRWFAFEIEPDVAECARERIRNTQPPLPGLVVPQQREMSLP